MIGHMLDSEIDAEGLEFKLILEDKTDETINNSPGNSSPTMHLKYNRHNSKNKIPPRESGSPTLLNLPKNGLMNTSIRSGVKSPTKFQGSNMAPSKVSAGSKVAALKMKGIKIPNTFMHDLQPLVTSRTGDSGKGTIQKSFNRSAT